MKKTKKLITGLMVLMIIATICALSACDTQKNKDSTINEKVIELNDTNVDEIYDAVLKGKVYENSTIGEILPELKDYQLKEFDEIGKHLESVEGYKIVHSTGKEDDIGKEDEFSQIMLFEMKDEKYAENFIKVIEENVDFIYEEGYSFYVSLESKVPTILSSGNYILVIISEYKHFIIEEYNNVLFEKTGIKPYGKILSNSKTNDSIVFYDEEEETYSIADIKAPKIYVEDANPSFPDEDLSNISYKVILEEGTDINLTKDDLITPFSEYTLNTYVENENELILEFSNVYMEELKGIIEIYIKSGTFDNANDYELINALCITNDYDVDARMDTVVLENTDEKITCQIAIYSGNKYITTGSYREREYEHHFFFKPYFLPGGEYFRESPVRFDIPEKELYVDYDRYLNAVVMSTNSVIFFKVELLKKSQYNEKYSFSYITTYDTYGDYSEEYITIIMGYDAYNMTILEAYLED